VGEVDIGGSVLVLMAGPCSVESRDQILAAAAAAAASGARFLRGGARKVRTSPASFQGLGLEGYRLLHQAASAYGLLTVSEVQCQEHLEEADGLIDLLQIGARSMQNIPLLRAVGKSGKPVLLKRGLASTVDEWLAAAQYILEAGNPNVILCERGIRSFETATRFTLDVSAIPIAKKRSGLPVVVDPSHAAGKRSLVLPLALAGVAAGADGLLIEMHPNPGAALSDGPQSLTPEELLAVAAAAVPVARAVGRDFPSCERDA